MRKLLDILALEPCAGDFGIEIEVEGNNLPDVEGNYWKTEPDGSLRNGKEYIMRKPKDLKSIPAILKHLNRQFDKAGAELDFSFRTSVHVHMNAQQLTYQQVLNVIYTYLLLEEPLVNFCGEGRKGNRFCLRLSDAEGLLDALNSLFRNGERELRNITHDYVRYSSINVEALRKYGSLEFRAMHGTTDVNKITKWCTALSNIRDFAMQMGNPSEIFNLFSKMEPQAFLEAVLGEVAADFIYPDMVKEIQRSFSLSIDLPFAYAYSQQREEEPQIRKRVIGMPRIMIPDEVFPA